MLFLCVCELKRRDKREKTEAEEEEKLWWKSIRQAITVDSVYEAAGTQECA